MIMRQGWLIVGASMILAACSGGVSAVSPSGAVSDSTDCNGSCFTAGVSLSVSDVQTIIAQAVGEAKARGVNATIAVVDRVGNVLAVFRMGDPTIPEVLISSDVNSSMDPLLHTGLDGIRLPAPGLATAHLDDQAAIAKAITGAYLSSEGNAFSTRTASQIIQEHFNVGELNQPSGPLFGVQFSSLACSDFIESSHGSSPGVGPHRSPLGLAADPGGFPLYKAGTPVGGVGAISDGLYGLDKDITATDVNVNDEAIAYAGSYSYAAPLDRRADQITVNGVTLRFSDVDATSLRADPSMAPPFSTLGSAGAMIAVRGYADGQIHAGTAYGQPASGVRADTSGDFPGEEAYVFVDAANVPRYPPIAGTDGANALTQAEVTRILSSALATANEARAQIRLPVGLAAQVTISVVDTQGVVLGMVRSPDAPLFGADVSIQKARAAALFSSASAAAFVQGLPVVRALETDASGYPTGTTTGDIGAYIGAAQVFLSRPSAFADGAIAFSDRAIANLSRPFFPDGIDGNPHGPFSKPAGQWSVFSTGLQLDLSNNAILAHVLYVAGVTAADVTPGCAGVQLSSSFVASPTVSSARLANGLQIFPGSVPIYRGSALVGGIGVSGDGVDQDDMIAFLGLERAVEALNGSALSQAPAQIRADTLTPKGTRLQYVLCPQAPFLDSTAENVCAGF